MRIHRFATIFSLLITLIASIGCSRDPNVKKQKYLESGNRYFEHGKYREAAIQFSNAIQVDPSFAKAHYQLAQAYLHTQNWTNAYKELHRTIDLDPKNLKAQLDLTGLLIGGRAYPEAQSTIDKILQQDPNNADAHLLLANLHMSKGDRDGALPEIQKAIALDPKRPQLYVQLASFQATNDPTSAESSLKKALALDPKFVPAIESLAVIYQKTGRPEDAEKQFKQTIELAPRSLQARQYLARFYLMQNRKADAEQVIIRAKKELTNQEGSYRVLGEYYISVGELDKATAEFASLTKDHPKDLWVKETYIDLLLNQNKLEEATKLNDESLKENPKDSSQLLIRGRIQNMNGKFTDAISTLQNALKYAPDNALGHYQLGVALSATGDSVRAEQEWRQAAKLAPRMNEAQLALAKLAITKGDHDLLRQTADQLVKNLPSDPRGYVFRANAELFANQPAAAEADLKQSIAVAPQVALGYAALGTLVASRGRLPEAQRFFEQALDRDPNELEAVNGLVAIFSRQGQNQKAIECVQQQILKSPNNDSYYALLGGLQASNKDYTDAEQSLQKSVALNKNNLSAFMMLSKVEMAQGSNDKALATVYKSIESNPKNVSGYFAAGMLEDARGNWQNAEKLYQQALQVEPNYPLAANNLAYGMLQHNENADVALSLAQVARQKMPDSTATADTLAWAYYQKGIYSLAAELLEDTVKKAPNDATAHYHLGMVYQKQNNMTNAKKQLERALQINPKAPNAEEIRRALNQLG